jgi:chromosome segregation ATPase
MATTGPKPPAALDPSIWVEAQRRNFEAFTSAGQIVADSMRVVAERQAAMMQDAMRGLWGEMQQLGSQGPKAAEPTDQLDRLRAAYERVTSQVQEISGVLLKAQSEAMEVLNRCAAANMEQLSHMAPDLAAMQKAATDAMQAATVQVSGAIEEMRRRMTSLEDESRKAMGGGPSPTFPPAKPAGGKSRT